MGSVGLLLGKMHNFHSKIFTFFMEKYLKKS